MVYKKYDDTIVIRLSPKDEVLSAIEKVVINENITLGTITGIGAADKATVGLYIVKEKRYVKNTYNKEMEITSLMGNISTKDDKPYLHIHANLADEEGTVIGGHLNELVISATCEIFIKIIDGKIGRIIDDYTGLNILDI